ncbi:MAG TPA: GNAT family N-acetyltransferase [Candidatus Nanopelagicales bacterium]|nr:GNAT family N-acetyltransferase [Candidatus Nanopelagicales bacterium]
MTVALRAVTPDDLPLLERLAQLEAHDLSEVTGALPDSDGLFADPRLERFVDRPGAAAYVVEHDGSVAGFCLVREVEGRSFVHSFFVVRALRRRGVGATAAAALLATRPGPWTIAVVERYEAVARFWRGVATSVAGASWTEDRRDHAGETFAWISLESPST